MIQAGQLPGLILLYGPETYFIDEAVRLISAAVVPAASRDFNLTQYHGRDFRAVEVVEQALTYPAFAERRLVIVKNLHDASAEQLDGLLSYLDSPVPETVFVMTAEKIDARRKVFQSIKKNGKVIEFKKLYDNQLPAYVKEFSQSLGITLTSGALILFCRRVGTHLTEVQGEMEKLLSYLGERDIADEKDVAAVVSNTRVESVFDLTDALGRGDAATSLKLLHRILAEGEAPLMILAMITRHFRQMWKVSEYLAQKLSQNELPRRVGISPFFLTGLIQQSRRYNNDDYRHIFRRFLATDLALKSSGSEPRLQLESLMLEIAGTGKENGEAA